MQNFKIALVQHNSIVGRKKENLNNIIRWARKASQAGAVMVCFPELSVTGHVGHPTVTGQAEPVPQGPSLENCVAFHEILIYIYVCAGIAEEDRGIYYNTQFLVGPQGYVGKQRKIHLSLDEYYYFRAGTELSVFELSLVRLGIIICSDNFMPEISRCLVLKGAELLLCPHAGRFGKWPKDLPSQRKRVKDQKEIWRLVHSCRAYDNGCYVALCNLAGRSAVGIRGVQANHAGGCMVIDPNGHTIAESRSRSIREEIIVAQLDGDLPASRRSQPCFNLQTRRQEVFRCLSEPTT